MRRIRSQCGFAVAVRSQCESALTVAHFPSLEIRFTIRIRSDRISGLDMLRKKMKTVAYEISLEEMQSVEKEPFPIMEIGLDTLIPIKKTV